MIADTNVRSRIESPLLDRELEDRYLSLLSLISFFYTLEFLYWFLKSSSRFFVFLFLQAYTNELELEVKHLMEENARLKRQQAEVS